MKKGMKRAGMKRTDMKRTGIKWLLRSGLVLVALGTSLAQSWQETGAIDARLEEDQRAWFTLSGTMNGEVINTARWQLVEAGSTPSYGFTLQGHAEPDPYFLEGMLQLSFTLLGSPDSCPCRVVAAEASYFVTGSLSSQFYLSDVTTLTLTELSRVDDNSFSLSGEFVSTLFYYDQAPLGPDTRDLVTLEGRFAVIASRQGP